MPIIDQCGVAVVLKLEHAMHTDRAVIHGLPLRHVEPHRHAFGLQEEVLVVRAQWARPH